MNSEDASEIDKERQQNPKIISMSLQPQAKGDTDRDQAFRRYTSRQHFIRGHEN